MIWVVFRHAARSPLRQKVMNLPIALTGEKADNETCFDDRNIELLHRLPAGRHCRSNRTPENDQAANGEESSCATCSYHRLSINRGWFNLSIWGCEACSADDVLLNGCRF